MEKIEKLLERFKKLGSEDRKIKEFLIGLLKKDFNTQISKDIIEIKDKKIRISISGPAKTTIILNKNNILKSLDSEGYEILDIN